MVYVNITGPALTFPQKKKSHSEEKRIGDLIFIPIPAEGHPGVLKCIALLALSVWNILLTSEICLFQTDLQEGNFGAIGRHITGKSARTSLTGMRS